MSANPTSTRRLAAIVVADVVGYSRLLAADEAATLAALKERRKAVVEPLVRQHAGRVVKFMGDGVLIEFPSAVNAVAFALDLQRRMAEMNEPLPEARRIVLRVGINLGEVVGAGADIFGDGVNIASRLEAMAEPGGIAISGKVYEEVRGKVDLMAKDMGDVALKNIAAPVRVWRVGPREAAASPITGVSERITIAVLPFDNMSGDASQEYFVDGLTEDLITALSKFRFFSVMSRNSTFQFKGRAVDVAAVGRQLGARYVLEGSIRVGGNRLRVNAQLIEVRTGAHVWAERFDREMADVFAVQDEIVNAIAGQLTGSVIDAEVSASHRVQPAKLTAYDLFLRGRATWRRGAIRETFDNCIRSVAADPTYGPALASLAFMYSEELWMQMTGMTVAEARERSCDYIAKAIAADDGDPFTQLAIATALLDVGELERAKQHFEIALTLNPHDPHTTINLGCTLAFMGLHEQGLSLISKAFRIDPRMPPAMFAVPFYVHSLMGDVDGAKAAYVRLQDPLPFQQLLMAACLSAADHMEEAVSFLAKFEATRPKTFDVGGFADVVEGCLRLPADKDRWRRGLRGLGLNV